jgi:ferredoxin
MMTAMRAHLVGIGVPDAEIHQEAFISAPRATETDREPAADELDGPDSGEGRRVNFQRAGKIISLGRGVTVLEAAEEAEVEIPYECRSGICGQCKTRLISGRVVMETRDALSPAEQARGLFLACQARAAEDLVVDA